MEIPQLKRGARLDAASRERLGRELLRKYQAGSSVRQLCAETGYSIGRVRRLLEEVGVEFRSRGGGHRRRVSSG